MLLSNSDSDDTLTNVNESCLLSMFESFAPSGEETWFEIIVLMGAVASSKDGWFMYFGVAAIDFEFFDSGCFFELGDIKGFHF